MAELRGARVREYVEASLYLLARESPRHFCALRSELGTLEIAVLIGGERDFSLCLSREPPWTRAPQPSAAASVELARTAVDAFVRGELSVERALRTNQLAIRARPHCSQRVLDAFHIAVHGALRARSFAALCRSYLEDLPAPRVLADTQHDQENCS